MYSFRLALAMCISEAKYARFDSAVNAAGQYLTFFINLIKVWKVAAYSAMCQRGIDTEETMSWFQYESLTESQKWAISFPAAAGLTAKRWRRNVRYISGAS